MARLGQLLIRANLVSENNLARALGVQHFAGGRLGTLLLERGSVGEDDLGAMLADQHGCEYVPWRVLGEVSPMTIAALPAKFAIKHSAVPYERGEGFLKLALRDPGDLRILDELFFVTGRKIIPAVAPEVRMYQALEKYYGERRTPRFAILAEKLSRPTRVSRTGAPTTPPPPDFFPTPARKPPPAPAPSEVWGEGAAEDSAPPPIIQDWKKLPETNLGGWAGFSSPMAEESGTHEPESISWEEMAPPLWLPAPPETPAVEPFFGVDTGPAGAVGRSAESSAPFPQAEEVATQRGGGVGVSSAVPPSEAFQHEPPPPPEMFLPEPPVAAPPKPPVPPEPAPPLVSAPTPERIEQPAERPEPPVPPPAATPPAAPLPIGPEAQFAEVVGAKDRDSIAAAAFAALCRRFVRCAVFIAKPKAVTGWAAGGEGVDADAVRSVEIPWDQPSVFLNVRLSRAFYLGALPPLPRHDPIARAFGGWAEECVVQPVLIKEKPVAFLYAEFPRDHGATPLDLAYLRELASAASGAFVGAIRLRKKEI